MRNLTLSIIFLIAGFSAIINTNAQWQQANTSLGNNNVNDVEYSGSNLFAATTTGLWKSTNEGSSWTQELDTNLIGEIKQIAVSGSNVFCASFGKGIIRSTDNGTTWTPCNSGFMFTYACGVVIHGSTVYASMSFDDVYYSTDNGNSWNHHADATLSSITVNDMITAGSNLVACSGSCNGGTTGGVLFSTDGGTTWSATSVTGDTDDLTMLGSNIFAATQDGVFMSTDNGATWDTTSTNVPTDHALALSVIGSTLIAGTPYGVYSTTDNGNSWTDVSAGAGGANMSITSFVQNATNIFAGNIYHPVGVWKRPLSELGTVNSVSINEFDAFSIYPNPCMVQLIIDIKDFENTSAQILNLQGQVMQSITLQGSKTNLNVEELVSGSYLLRITDGKKVSVKKFIKR